MKVLVQAMQDQFKRLAAQQEARFQGMLEAFSKKEGSSSFPSFPAFDPATEWRDYDLTFAAALQKATESEDAAQVARDTLHTGKHPVSHEPAAVHKVAKSLKAPSSPSSKLRNRSFPAGTCPRCGRTDHTASNCRHKTSTCNFCKKRGHIEPVCLKKRHASVHVVSTQRVGTLKADTVPQPTQLVRLNDVLPSMMNERIHTYDIGIAQGKWKPGQFNSSGTPVVPVRKGTRSGHHSSGLRVCGDYSVSVKSLLDVPRHPLPLPEDLIRKLGGGHYFTKLDLADAYSQIPLGPVSQKKLALSTHKGVLLQMRLPQGISSAPAYFQEIMHQLTSDLPGVAVYLDDLLVTGSDATSHLENLR